jgi:hypothetical protein
MSASSRRFNARHPRFKRAAALAIAFGAIVVAARGMDPSWQSVKAACEQAAPARQVICHRNQAEAYELDSVTGFLRLFSTIADQLGTEASEEQAALLNRSCSGPIPIGRA